MAITIKSPINKSVLAEACNHAGMSDGAKQVFVGYFEKVLNLYNNLLEGVATAPASSATTAPATAETGSTPVTSNDKVVA